MKKQIKPETIIKNVKHLIEGKKFLKDAKYYKTNKVSCAAWDSWAARGQAGGCDTCNIGHHNYSLHNKRYSKGHSGKGAWSWNTFGKLCSECYEELEKQVKYKFIKY